MKFKIFSLMLPLLLIHSQTSWSDQGAASQTSPSLAKSTAAKSAAATKRERNMRGRGVGAGGGGNFSGLDAASALRLLPEKIKMLGADLVTAEQLQLLTEVATSGSTVVAISPKPIPTDIAGIMQESSAYTASGESSTVILIYQGDWDAHKGNFNEQIAFMAHEACVAVGIEQTGQYGSVSAELLNRLNRQTETSTPSVSTQTFEHPLVRTGYGYPPDSSPSWAWVYNFRPILVSETNGRNFCLGRGYDNYASTELKSEPFASVGFPGALVAAKSILVGDKVSEFEEMPGNLLFKGKIISSITCTRESNH